MIDLRPPARRRAIACNQLALTLESRLKILGRLGGGEFGGPVILAVRPDTPVPPELIEIWPACRLPGEKAMAVIDIEVHHADTHGHESDGQRQGLVEAGVPFSLRCKLFDQPGGIAVRIHDLVSNAWWEIIDVEEAETSLPQGRSSDRKVQAAIEAVGWFQLPPIAGLLAHLNGPDAGATARGKRS